MKMGKMKGAFISGFRIFSLGWGKLTYSPDSTLTDMRKVSFRRS